MKRETLFMASVMMLSAISGCSQEVSITEASNDETKVAVVSETTTEQTPEEETTTTSETTLEEISQDIYTPVSRPTDDLEMVSDSDFYELAMKKVDELNSENPEALQKYFYAEEYNNGAIWVLGVEKPEENTIDWYGVKDNELYCYYSSSLDDKYYASFEYEDFKKIPCPTVIWGPNPTLDWNYVDGFEDGSYCGSLLAISSDGTKALVSLGEHMRISDEEYNSLKPGDEVTVVYCDPYAMPGTAIVPDDFDASKSDVSWSLGTSDFYLNASSVDGYHHVSMMDDGAPEVNPRIAIIDLSKDIKLYDPFGERLPEEEREYVNGHEVNNSSIYSDADTNFKNSAFYHEATQSFGLDENNKWWQTQGAQLPEVVIENGEITYMFIRTW